MSIEVPRKGFDNTEMRTYFTLMLALAATCLSSCVALPIRYHTRPDIYGTVTRNGAPVEGAKIGYSDDLTDSDCDSPVVTHPEQVVSEANGAFHFEGAYSFFHIIYVKPHPAEFVTGRICINTPDGQHFSQQFSLPGGLNVGSIPDTATCAQLEINCDLDHTCTGAAQ